MTPEQAADFLALKAGNVFSSKAPTSIKVEGIQLIEREVLIKLLKVAEDATWVRVGEQESTGLRELLKDLRDTGVDLI